MSAPADLGGFHRVHPATPFLRGGLALVVVAVYVGRSLVEGGSVPYPWLVLPAAVVAGLGFGLVSWWFTRFRISATELRIDSGVFVRRSRRVKIERLQAVEVQQPLLARLFAMAELTFETAGGGGDDKAKLAFLPLGRAESLRADLLGRARGLEGEVARTGLGPVEPLAPERVLFSVQPGPLLASQVLRAAFVGLVVPSVGGVVIQVLTGTPLGFALFIPTGLAALSFVANGFVARFGFTASRTAEGLRLRSGLLNVRSQTIPTDRVQGIVLHEPLAWRPLGWVSVRVTVAGSKYKDDQKNISLSTLVPVASRAVALRLVAEVLGSADPDAVSLAPAPRAARWLDPLGAAVLRYGADDRLIVTRRGVLSRRTDVVPRHKPQSVRVTQGPVQRALRLASVHVDLPSGPVEAVGRHRDAAECWQTALALTRAPRTTP
ncbi:MAG: PH domain-containing protein [Nocardioidaceae bacterium]